MLDIHFLSLRLATREGLQLVPRLLVNPKHSRHEITVQLDSIVSNGQLPIIATQDNPLRRKSNFQPAILRLTRARSS